MLLRDTLKGYEMDDILESSNGVNIAAPKILAFTLAAIYGCISGSLYAVHMQFITPTTFTFELSTTYVIIMMVGGIGSVPGIILGSAIVTILPEALRFLGDFYWIIFSIIVLVQVVLKPNGLISFFTERKNEEDEVIVEGEK